MTMLPEPTSAFTIPSIYDDTVLDCRIYVPLWLGPNTSCPGVPSRKKAAIVAHPYGPLGGDYNNPIVHLIGSTLLQQDFIIGTFNFRGAGGSKGRTSWTAKAEINDCMSVVGFMIYFMEELRIVSSGQTMSQDEDTTLLNLSPVPSNALPLPREQGSGPFGCSTQALLNTNGPQSQGQTSKPLLLMAGYSYGAMITSLIPKIGDILELFATPDLGSAASEIRLRAQKLASMQNEAYSVMAARLSLRSISDSSLGPVQKRGRGWELDETQSSRRISSSTVRIGGEESNPEHRRISHDARRRSFEPSETIRRSIDRVRSNRRAKGAGMPPRGLASRKSMGTITPTVERRDSTSSLGVNFDGVETKTLMQTSSPVDTQIAYLLVSPLQGIVNNLATMWSTLPKTRHKAIEMSEEETKLVRNTTFAIYGEVDGFTSSRRLQVWCERMSNLPNSRFSSVEIKGAGHFWHEDGVADRMRNLVQEFARTL